MITQNDCTGIESKPTARKITSFSSGKYISTQEDILQSTLTSLKYFEQMTENTCISIVYRQLTITNSTGHCHSFHFICYHASSRVVPHISPETPAVPPPLRPVGRGRHVGVKGDICGTTREEIISPRLRFNCLHVQRVISAREGDIRYIILRRTIETATKG